MTPPRAKNPLAGPVCDFVNARMISDGQAWSSVQGESQSCFKHPYYYIAKVNHAVASSSFQSEPEDCPQGTEQRIRKIAAARGERLPGADW
jgi:hypothetical protein